ncbi:MAG: DinB family protein [Chitinophagaceae bacterium]
MKRYKSIELLDQLQSDVRALLVTANYLKSEDPAILLEQPAPGKWTVIQVVEHLNSYGLYYLPALEKSLQEDKPAVEMFKPGLLGNYFTKMMKPVEGKVKYKMKSPKDHRPGPFPDPMPVLQKFISQQQTLLDLLEKAKAKNIGAIRTPASISKWVRMKMGDTFRFLIAHELRHFVQITRTLEHVKKAPAFSMVL